jgi:hypothetical protein
MDKNRGKKDEKRLIESYLAREKPAERAELQRKLTTDHEFRWLLIDLLEMQASESDWDVLMPAARELAHGIIDLAVGTDDPRKGVVTFDSKLLPLPEGVRRAGVDTRRLKVNLGEGRLSLSLYPISPKSYRVMGQLHNVEYAEEYAAVIQAAGQSLKACCNSGGVFSFDRVPAGECEISLRRGNELISEFTIVI